MTVGADFNKLEALQARRDGAQIVKNSGRGMRKGDAKRGTLLIDYKFTEKGSFALNDKAFHKHYIDAYKESLEGVVVAVFTETNRKIAMVDWEYLMALIDERDYLQGKLQSLEEEDMWT